MEIIKLNDTQLEKSFLNLYDRFLKLNLYIQTNYKSDKSMKNKMRNIVLIFEDLAEHYYWEEINRVKEEIDGDTKTH